jgi:RNA polymerase sigma factor (sigma-70 family)
MNDEKINKFNEFYVNQYKYLLGFSRSINPQADYESLLHDCYLKCRDRIEKNGFDGLDYMNFVRVTIMNQYKSNYRNIKKKQLVDIEDPDYYNTIESVSLTKEIQQEQQNEIYNKNIYLNTIIFEYVDKNFTARDQFIFKTYYLLKHKHLNYKTLSEVTGYSITSVSNTIKRMKKAIRTDIMSYILTGNTNNG